MQNPLVTVFIPVYNCEDYIGECLDSILGQTYENIEVLLVNDGSTDRSVEVINAYSDPRIRLIENEKNMGIPYTRNVGLEEAKGQYMAIMDSDDIAMPNRVEKQVKFMEQNPDIDAVGTYYIKFIGNKTQKITTKFTSPEEVKAMLLFFDPIANPSSMVRLESLKKYNLKYNPDHFVSQDYGLWAQLSKYGKLAIMPEFLLKYRFGHENITKKSKRDKAEKRKKIINSIHEDLLQFYGINLTEDEMDVFNELFSYNYGAIKNISSISDVMNKLKLWNQQAKTFNNDVFLNVLDNSFFIGISNQQIGLMDKINLYNEHMTKRNLRELAYIIAKHFYYRMKR